MPSGCLLRRNLSDRRALSTRQPPGTAPCPKWGASFLYASVLRPASQVGTAYSAISYQQGLLSALRELQGSRSTPAVRRCDFHRGFQSFEVRRASRGVEVILLDGTAQEAPRTSLHVSRVSRSDASRGVKAPLRWYGSRGANGLVRCLQSAMDPPGRAGGSLTPLDGHS